MDQKQYFCFPICIFPTMDSKTWIENTLFSINGCSDPWMQRANYGVKSYMWTTGGKGQYPNPALFKDHLRIWNLTPPLQPHCQHPELSSHRLSLDHCRCFKQVSLFPPTENILSRAPGMVLLKYQSDFISLLLKALQLDPIPLRKKKKNSKSFQWPAEHHPVCTLLLLFNS